MKSSDGDDTVIVNNTEGSATLLTGNGVDLIRVDGVGGYLEIDSGNDDDEIEIYALGGDAYVFGGNGTDVLKLDARDPNSEEPHNTMDGSTLSWNGGHGDDRVEMYFVSEGTTNLNITGDKYDVNQLIARCSDDACTILSRRLFLANIHHPGILDSSVERINLDNDTASLSGGVLLYLNDGENSVHFDDTMAKMVSLIQENTVSRFCHCTILTLF